MRVLVWNMHEFVECLGVLPETDEDYTFHTFKVRKDGLRLDLTVFEYAGGVYIDLYREGVGTPAFSARLTDCEAARYVSDKGGESLEFAPAGSLGSRRYDGAFGVPFGIRVAVTPHIKVELF